MKVTVTGASGLIGAPLVRKLLAEGYSVHVLGRKRDTTLPSSVSFSEWDSSREPPPESLVETGAVIHLAGEPVAQRWSPEVKARIRKSRVEGTRHLVHAMSTASPRPKVLVCGSAIGYYGSRGDEVLTEASGPGGDFLAQVAIDWEKAAELAEALGIRVVRIRTSMVLGHGGALAKMLPPFRFGVGGRLGSGRQWMSWIHVDDEVNLILFAMQNEAVRGAVNGATAYPVTNAEFTRELADVLNRPAILPVPEFALRLMFGEMADVILGSQRVLPEAAEAAGFRFAHPKLGPALGNLLSD